MPGMELPGRTARTQGAVLCAGAGFAPFRSAVAPFLDPRGFTRQAAQVVQLGAPDRTATGDLDLFHARRLEHERALDAHAVSHAAHAETAIVDVGLLDLEHHPFEHLGTLAVALDHAHVHAHGVARPNGGQVAAALQLQQIGKFRHSSSSTCAEYTRDAREISQSNITGPPYAAGRHTGVTRRGTSVT